MLRKVLFGLTVFVIFAVNVAATGTSQADAVAIASIVALVLPFLYKYVPAAGHYMVAITVIASAATALGAEFMSGEVTLATFNKLDPTVLYLSVTSVYGLSQFVYALLIQSPKTVNAVV